MTISVSREGKTKHDSKGKGITSTQIKIERQFANTCQSAILNFAHLKYILFLIIHLLSMSELLSGHSKFTCLFLELPPNTHISSFNDAAQEESTSVLAS